MNVTKREMFDLALTRQEAEKLMMLLEQYNCGVDYNLPDYMKPWALEFTAALDREGVGAK